MGPFPSDGVAGVSFFNVEGDGFVGARNLLKSPAPFEEFHVFTIIADDNEVTATADGQEPGRRERFVPLFAHRYKFVFADTVMDVAIAQTLLGHGGFPREVIASGGLIIVAHIEPRLRR